MLMKRLGLMLACVVLPVASIAQQAAYRMAVEDVRKLMIAAIDAPSGEAHGMLVGQMAQAITQKLQAHGPILVDVTTERRYKQPGCSRLKLTFAQEGVVLPGAKDPTKHTVDIGINYCRDGTPPRSLS
jgi:hypothetical protein